ncbi:MAG: LLM class flavin-dependent oxidoreductase [Defluviicoccus sp.]|nr:LLM class flavin-dependent oxidoreductase [Defluviicoccus sp.]
MKFSFFMMPVHHPRENPTLAFRRDIELIHLADALDYDEFFIGEHHSGGWETMPAPEMALAMAAASAHRIRLGTSVVSLPFHHPFHVAERMAFLDHLTRGRAILGVGPCNLATDKKLFSITDDRLYPMMYEAIDVIVRLLESSEPFSHRGEFWTFDDLRLQLLSYQQPRMPLAIATSGTKANLEVAGRHDMLLLQPVGRNLSAHYGDAKSQWAQVEAAASAAGRTADRSNWRLATAIHLAETRDQAWDEAAAGLMSEAEYFSAIGLKPAYEEFPGQPFEQFTPESCVERRDFVVGTPDDMIAWIERKQAETGGFGGVMLTTHEWTDHEKYRRSLDMVARYVMPHFRGSNRIMRDEWDAIQRQVRDDGKVVLDPARPSNLATVAR